MTVQIAGVKSRKETEMTTLRPYLLFDGNCRQAMEFYRSCLGAELILAVVKDTPAKERIPASQHDKVLNARLRDGNVDVSMFRHRTGYCRTGRESAATPFVSVSAEGHLKN
jgi:uncharacterized glyoxalase superfamily protein PhnB